MEKGFLNIVGASNCTNSSAGNANFESATTSNATPVGQSTMVTSSPKSNVTSTSNVNVLGGNPTVVGTQSNVVTGLPSTTNVTSTTVSIASSDNKSYGDGICVSIKQPQSSGELNANLPKGDDVHVSQKASKVRHTNENNSQVPSPKPLSQLADGVNHESVDTSGNAGHDVMSNPNQLNIEQLVLNARKKFDASMNNVHLEIAANMDSNASITSDLD
jgi:hypothetical protein